MFTIVTIVHLSKTNRADYRPASPSWRTAWKKVFYKMLGRPSESAAVMAWYAEALNNFIRLQWKEIEG